MRYYASKPLASQIREQKDARPCESLRAAIFDARLEMETEQRTQRLLDEMRKLKVRKLWVNTDEHGYPSTSLKGYTHVIAQSDAGVDANAFWSAVHRAGLRYGCGNGMSYVKAAQAQIYHRDAIYLRPGLYDFSDEIDA